MGLAQALYLFAPLLLSAALAGVVQRFDWFSWLRRPVDAGLRFRGRRIFGSSKTLRGFAIAIIGCLAGTLLQKYALASRVGGLSAVDYSQLDAIGFGAAMGLGAMLGELPNSFVKRQSGIAPGKTAKGLRALLFYVWDQVDLLFGAWPCIAAWVHPSPRLVLASFAIALSIHPAVSLLGFLVGARRTWR